MDKKYYFFFRKHMWGSQWYPSIYIVNGVKYHCNEQYMMAQKALLFNDTKIYDKIMKTKDPKRIKALGRQVNNFEDNIWDNNKYRIVLEANYAKFSQNLYLKDQLLQTGDKIIAEASPYDNIWGIGLTASDKRAQDMSKWLGQNLLGKALMETREKLK